MDADAGVGRGECHGSSLGPRSPPGCRRTVRNSANCFILRRCSPRSARSRSCPSCRPGIRSWSATDRSTPRCAGCTSATLRTCPAAADRGKWCSRRGEALTDPARASEYPPGLARAGRSGVVIELRDARRPDPGLGPRGGTQAGAAGGRAAPPGPVLLTSPSRCIARSSPTSTPRWPTDNGARGVHRAEPAAGLDRADPDEAADMLDTPIAGGPQPSVLAFAGHGVPAAVLLDDWQRRSRLTSWTACPVGPYREVWGRLIAPEVADADAHAVMTLERAAQALACTGWSSRTGRRWSCARQSGLVDDLRRGRVVDEAEARPARTR